MRADVDRVADVLLQSDYELTFCGYRGDTRASAGHIRAAVNQACARVPRGGTLLIYFSGHGVTIDGQSMLVPCDAVAEVGTGRLSAEDLVVAVRPRGLETCQAGLVVLLLDACRDDDSSDFVPDKDRLGKPQHGSLVVLSSCLPGQKSGYTDTGSFFTQALADVLDIRHPARTIDNVISAVRHQMTRKSSRTEGMLQEPGERWSDGGNREWAGTVQICEGDQVTQAWQRAVAESPLWERSTGRAEATETVRRIVQDSLTDYATRWIRAADRLRTKAGMEDRWTDQNYPGRVLAMVEMLLPVGTRLSPAELGLLTSAPFLREAALADGLYEAAGIAPTDFQRTYADGPRSDLELTHAMHEHVRRRAEGSVARGDRLSGDALSMWLVHTWLGDRRALWHTKAVKQDQSRLVKALWPHVQSGGHTAGELSQILAVMVSCSGGDLGPLELNKNWLPGRFPTLTTVLALAGLLAVDTRRLPAVVADHVGIGGGLQPDGIRVAVGRLRWQHGEERTIELHAVCEHPAVHDAFEKLAIWAHKLIRAGRALLDEDDLLRQLPLAVNAAGLRAEVQDGTNAYEVPLSRFRLSDDKVRELLMGRDLYEDPALAIRELYQNALDACRFRETRRGYLKRIGRRSASWAGRITFTQGVEGDRPYIECVDNGVGMDATTLKNTFAAAGERFVYRQDFRLEQAKWQELDPPIQLIPNSQFGVGVFSYFMLAEEILIETRPVDADEKKAAQAFSVRIASSGSLFQMRSSADAMPDGGTLVRLYLTDTGAGVSCLRTLRNLLWLSEFDVVAEEKGVGRQEWQRGLLRYTGETGATPVLAHEDLWWVASTGRLLSDGIKTEKEQFGYVLNLHGRQRPLLSVNRNSVRDWNQDFELAAFTASLPGLLDWQGLTMHWLWELARDAPSRAEIVYRYLCERQIAVPGGGSQLSEEPIPLHRVGLEPRDLEIIPKRSPGSQFERWRQQVWHAVVSPSPSTDTVAAVSGFPIIGPSEASLLSQVGEQPHSSAMLSCALAEGQSVARVVDRIRKFAIVGLDLSAVRRMLTVSPTGEERRSDIVRLAAAMMTWVDDPRNTDVIGRLVAVAGSYGITVREALDGVAQVATGWSPPVLDIEGADDLQFEAIHGRLVSVDFDGVPPWTPYAFSPADVIGASDHLGLTVEELLGLFDDLKPLGYSAVGAERFPATLTELEKNAISFVHEPGHQLSSLEIFVIAARENCGLRDVIDGVQRLVATGMVGVPEPSAVPNHVPTAREQSALVGLLSRSNRFPDLVSAILIRVTDKATSLAEPTTGVEDLRVLARCALDAGVLRILDLAEGAASRHRSLTWVLSVLEDIVGHRLDISGVDREVLDDTLDNPLRWGWYGFTSRNSNRPMMWNVSLGGMVRSAMLRGIGLGEMLSAAEPLRSLGAPVPVIAEADQEVLRGVIPDQGDIEILEALRKAGGAGYFEVTPLRIVQIAGRLGWTLPYANQRCVRIAPLGLRLDYDPATLPDGIILWQDLLLLTEFHDGQAPAVSGRCSPEHIALAAKYTEQPEAWVRQRLRIYAGLFNLSLEGLGDEDGDVSGA